MKILVITDIHYGENINYPKLGGENYINSYGSNFSAFLPKLREVISCHDLVVNLGDLIHETEAEQDLVAYKKALALFGSETLVKSVIGNHDVNTLSPEQLAVLIGESKLYYSFDQGGYHHIVLDGFRETKDFPYRIEQEQLEWLKNDLEMTKLNTVVYCHYPVDDQNLDSNYYFRGRPDRALISNREEVRAILEGSKKVLAVFNGHLHFFNRMNINGIEYVTVPSFTENNGNDKPKAECLSVLLEEKNVHLKIVKMSELA